MRKLNDYSYNAGLPMQKVVVPTLSETVKLFDSLRKSGKVFRVDSFKKDGTRRTFVCRCGVAPKNPSSKGRAYNPGDKGLLSVFEFGKGYRSIVIDKITFIKHEGVGYIMNSSLPTGDYSKANLIAGFANKRTLHAKTSPMYN